MGIKLIRSEINMLTLFAHNPIWGSSPSKPTFLPSQSKIVLPMFSQPILNYAAKFLAKNAWLLPLFEFH
jgi:hypothetical protein